MVATAATLLIGLLWAIARDLLPIEVGLFLLGAAATILLPVWTVELLLARLPRPRLSAALLRRVVIALVALGPLALAVYLLGAEALAPMPLGPLALLAGLIAFFIDRFVPSRLLPDDPRYWLAACIAAAELLVAFAVMHTATQTFEWVRPGSERLHLILYVSTWLGTVGLVYPWAFRIRARSGSAPRPRWLFAWTFIAALAGVLLVEADRYAMVGLYPAIHAWMAFVGVLTLEAAIAPWAVRSDDSQAPIRPSLGATGTVSLAILVGAALIALTGDRAADPGFRASISETAIGGALLDHWSQGQPAPRSDDAALAGHPLLDYEHYRDERWPDNDLNILLISVDAFRVDSVPLPGAEDTSLAPNFAALAKTCADFRWAYSPSPRTSSSMGSLMVGRYNANVQWRLWIYKAGRMIDPRAPADADAFAKLGNKFVYTTMPEVAPGRLLAERMHSLGFFTAATPFAGLSDFFKHGFGFDVGFDVFADLTTKRSWLKKPTSMKIAKTAAKQLAPHKRKRWFQWIHFYDPHESRDRESYPTMVRHFDEGLGATLSWLEANGLREKTAIFLVSDHGEALGDHRHRTHGTSLYEEQTRVPMLVCVPGLKPQVFHQETTVLDVTATILALVGGDTSDLDGVNLLPLINEGRYPERRPVFIELSRYMSSEAKRTADLKGVVLDGWKYIWDRRKSTLKLFNLREDPEETTNLLSTEPEKASELGALLEAFVARGEGLYTPP